MTETGIATKESEMGHTIKLRSAGAAEKNIDTDLFSASLRDEGFVTNEVEVAGNEVVITVATSLMDDQFSDEEVAEDLVERATRVADTFGLAVTDHSSEHFRSEDSE